MKRIGYIFLDDAGYVPEDDERIAVTGIAAKVLINKVLGCKLIDAHQLVNRNWLGDAVPAVELADFLVLSLQRKETEQCPF
jgi:hypothetical protein